MSEESEPMVDAQTVISHFNIPKATFYRMVKANEIPAHEDPTSPYWRKRPRLLFRISEVDAALRNRRRA